MPASRSIKKKSAPSAKKSLKTPKAKKTTKPKASKTVTKSPNAAKPPKKPVSQKKSVAARNHKIAPATANKDSKDMGTAKHVPVKRRPLLTKSELRELENILLSDRRQHQRSSAGLEETLASERETSDGSGDMADASGDVATMESATLLASHTTRALLEIDSALRRLRQSPEYFGVCEVSGEPIPFARLSVVPTARTTAKNSRF